jgi:hypothetical protein
MVKDGSTAAQEGARWVGGSGAEHDDVGGEHDGRRGGGGRRGVRRAAGGEGECRGGARRDGGEECDHPTMKVGSVTGGEEA